MAASDKVRIQYASKYAQSSNYWKNSIGMSRGIQTLGCEGPQAGAGRPLSGRGRPRTRCRPKGTWMHWTRSASRWRRTFPLSRRGSICRRRSCGRGNSHSGALCAYAER
ncbi:MAG: S46 family peptidase [Alistipes shahii]